MTEITYCMMTQNRLSEVVHCLEKVLPHVTRCIVVDGGSIDDSIFYLRNWAMTEPKLKLYLHAWNDNFSGQRNNYLTHVPDNTWALVSDPDEWFEDDLLKALPNLVKTAEQNKRDMIGFQCRSVSLKGPNRVWENLDQYWKRLLFKKYPGTHYAGNPHEHLVNHPHQIMDTPYVYEHVKQENVIWHRGCRNMFVNGGGPNLSHSNPRWVKLRELCTAVGVNNWHQFDQYLIKGGISQEIADLILTFKDVTGFDGASEHRETYKLYYRIYHPEQEPEAFKGLHIE